MASVSMERAKMLLSGNLTRDKLLFSFLDKILFFFSFFSDFVFLHLTSPLKHQFLQGTMKSHWLACLYKSPAIEGN